ncbi:MAG: Uma2 family endonuclease [Verrucomicrobia bacterium]|nr:Uma2 family endonuclease [Verrucomicrobiota bacterium]
MSLHTTVEARKLTIREFHALEPVLDPDYRYELLDGKILVMPVPGNPHTTVWRRLRRQLLRHERPGLYPWEGGLVLGDNDEPWPDLTLVALDPEGRPTNPNASEAKLVVEISCSTLSRDTHEKLQAYQAAGVPEYWVIDVSGRRVLRHLLPGYETQAFSAGPLSPQAYPDVTIDVGALFQDLKGQP